MALLVVVQAEGLSRPESSGPAAEGRQPASEAVVIDAKKGPPAHRVPLRMLNVDFANRYVPRVGPAAVGLKTNDVWNAYVFGWRAFGSLRNLLWSDGTVSGIHLAVENAPGEWGNTHPDPMFSTYIYPHDGGNISVTVSGMPPGVYELYLYGHGAVDKEAKNPHCQNSVYSISGVKGGKDFGEKATTTGPEWASPAWKEGDQYVVFRDVVLHHEPLRILVKPGVGGYAILAGLQLAQIELSPEVVVMGQGAPSRSGPAPIEEISTADLSSGVIHEELNLDLESALRAYEGVVARFDRQRPAAAGAIFRLAECYRKLGRQEEARTQYERILREFPDQTQFTMPSAKALDIDPEDVKERGQLRESKLVSPTGASSPGSQLPPTAR